MELNVSNDERNMRDRMLRHEFSQEHEDWQAMAALLDEERQPGPPPPSPDAEPGASNKRWPLLLLLVLFVSLLGSVTLLWQPWTNGTDDSATFSGLPDGRPDAPGRPPGLSEGAPGQSQPENLPGNELAAVSVPVLTDEEETSGQRLQPSGLSAVQPNSGKGNSSRPLISNNDIAPAQTAAETGLPIAPGREKDTPAPLQEPPSGRNDAAGETSPQATSGMATFDLLPLRAAMLTPNPAADDTLIRPMVIQPLSSRGWERAWIFGALANTVGSRPFRLAVLPHFGHLLRYRFNPRSALQAELQLKFVSGYGLRAEFNDILPGGSTQIILETNNLLFVETPLVWRHTYHPGKAWLLGVRPSWNVALFPRGSVSVTNNGPYRDVSAHSGIRSFDLGLVLGWEWQWGRRWALDVRYNQGLFDLSFDNFYKSSETHLNSDLQISLRYFIQK